jgi:DNA-binding MarR family transcriptional regulator
VNTFLLAAVAVGLVAFLVFNRKRQGSAGAAPADERASAPSRARGRGRGRSRRGGTIQGYPDPVREATAAATAETAASRTLTPVLEPLPAAAPAPPPAEPAPPGTDWGFDEMIVEPGWPMPGEIAGAWPAAAPAPAPAPAPVAAVDPAPADVGAPVALADEPVAAEAVTGEWEMPVADAQPVAEPAAWPEPGDAPEPEAGAADEPAMEAWVPGVSEVEPVVLPEPEPAAAFPSEAPVEDEPALVWADPAPPAGAPPADEVAGPPAWRPDPVEADVEAEVVREVEPAPEPVAEEPVLPAWEPEPAPLAVEEPWRPEAGPEADPDAEIDAVAAGLPLAVASLTPVLSAADALGVTPRMAAVLRALADEPRGLPGLGRALGVSRPVVADVCARLEDLDLVWRERDPDDRRRMIVIPTEKGLKLAEEAVPGLDRQAVAGALGRLSPTERAALVTAVRILRDAPAR